MKPGLTACQAAATAASGSEADESTMAMRESPSGARRTMADPSTMTDHSLGAVKVAPPAVARGVSLAIFSGAGFAAAAAAGGPAGV